MSYSFIIHFFHLPINLVHLSQITIPKERIKSSVVIFFRSHSKAWFKNCSVIHNDTISHQTDTQFVIAFLNTHSVRGLLNKFHNVFAVKFCIGADTVFNVAKNEILSAYHLILGTEIVSHVSGSTISVVQNGFNHFGKSSQLIILWITVELTWNQVHSIKNHANWYHLVASAPCLNAFHLAIIFHIDSHFFQNDVSLNHSVFL